MRLLPGCLGITVNIEGYFFRRPAQRTKSIQMLNENHLEQDNWIHTGTAIVCTVQWLYYIVDLIEIYCFVDFTQQMSLRHQTFGVYDFKNTSFHFSTFQHLTSPKTIIAYKIEKAQLSLDFFDRLRRNGYFHSGVSPLWLFDIFYKNHYCNLLRKKVYYLRY